MSKKIVRIAGIIVTLAILIGLLVPAAPVSADPMQWTQLPTPKTQNGQLVAGFVANIYDVAPDGVTVFAYNPAAAAGTGLYKSVDAGKTWTNTNLGANLPLGATMISVSNDYAADQTVVLGGFPGADVFNVYRSSDGGQNFSSMTAIAAGTITAIAVGKHYSGGQSILVGSTNAGAGIVFRFTTTGVGSYTWTNTIVGDALWIAGDVINVSFSPKHANDAEALAVTRNAAGTNVSVQTMFANNPWNADVNPATITVAAATGADLAFAADYDWSALNRVLVGIRGGAGADLWRVNGGQVPNTTTTADLGVNGSSSDTSVFSVDIKGNIADGTAVVGTAGDAFYAIGITSSNVTWTTSNKKPLGANFNVKFSQANNDLFCGSSTAFSISTDKGLIYSAISLINVSALANVQIGRTIDLNANTHYVILIDTVAPIGSYLFKTEDKGVTWKMLNFFAGLTAGGATGTAAFMPSRSFATDNCLYLVQADGRIWKTTDAGVTWAGLTAAANPVTAFAAIDANTYYTGSANAIYKAGRYTASIGFTGTPNAITVIGTERILVPTQNGDVYQSIDDGVNFTILGITSEMGAGQRVSLATDTAYATNKLVYATTALGMYKWTIGTSSTWEQIIGLLGGVATYGRFNLSRDGVAYFQAMTPVGTAPIRCVNPSALANQQTWDSIGGVAPINAVNAAITGFNAAFVNKAGGLAVAQTGTSFAPTNTLYATVTGAVDPVYGYADKFMVLEDTMVDAPEIVAPKANAQVAPAPTFSWKAVTSPATITPAYTVQLATDDKFQGVFGLPGAGVTTATSLVVPNTTPLSQGAKYFWRVYVSSPLTSKKTATTAIAVKLGTTGNVLAPTVNTNSNGLAPIRPVFTWSAVQGAESYELQVADNPFFANPQEKKPLQNTIWAWDKDLSYDTPYYYRVRAVAAGVASDWVAGAFNTVSAPVAPTATAAPTTAAPTTAAPKFFDPKSGLYFNTQAELQAYQTAHPDVPAPAPATPTYIWAIIAIGAVLVIAMIILIARTRRV